MNKKTRMTTLALTAMLSMGSIVPAYADSNKIVSMGADLTATQQATVLTNLNTSKDQCQIIQVNNTDERTALLGIVPELQIGTKTISCAYVAPAESGKGITVTTNNLTWVSEAMLRNALVTAGVKDAEVKATAPYPVSGTGALTGVMKAYEKSTGTTLDDAKKDAANQELVATGQLAENTKGLDQASASAMVNDIKKEVITSKPGSDAKIGQIVNDTSKQYQITLSPEDKQMLVSVMSKVNSLDYNVNEMKSTMNDISGTMKDQLAATGKVIEKLGVLDKIESTLTEFSNWCKSVWASITGGTTAVDGITYDKDGNIVTNGNVFIKSETKTPTEIKEEKANQAQIPSSVDVTEAQNKLEDAKSSDTKVDASKADTVIDSKGKVSTAIEKSADANKAMTNEASATIGVTDAKKQ